VSRIYDDDPYGYLPKTHNVTTHAEAKRQGCSWAGDPERMRLLLKTVNTAENWSRGLWAYEVPGVGVLVEATHQQGQQVAIALQFIPGVRVAADEHGHCHLVRANDAES
jgi:hypothetical protein